MDECVKEDLTEPEAETPAASPAGPNPGDLAPAGAAAAPASREPGRQGWLLQTCVAWPFLVASSTFWSFLAVAGSLFYCCRGFVAFVTCGWANSALWGCGVELTVSGAEHLADGLPKFFVGNHQSALDIPVLLSALKGKVRFMAKHTLFHIPVWGWAMRRFGYIPVYRSSPKRFLRVLRDHLARITENPISLVVFPEGTRSLDGKLLPFRKGAMKILKMTELPVVPFWIEGSLAVNRPRTLRINPGSVRVTFAAPLPAEMVAAMPLDELQLRLRQTIGAGLGQAVESEGPVG